MFESESVCGFCGHVFGTEAHLAPGDWPKTYRYQKWGVKGQYTEPIVATILFLGIGGVFFATMPRRPEMVGTMIGIIALMIAGNCAGFFAASRVVNNASVTLEADRVTWTTATGQEHSVPNSALYGAKASGRDGGNYMFGLEDGPWCNPSSNIENYKELIAEIKRRVGQ